MVRKERNNDQFQVQQVNISLEQVTSQYYHGNLCIAKEAALSFCNANLCRCTFRLGTV